VLFACGSRARAVCACCSGRGSKQTHKINVALEQERWGRKVAFPLRHSIMHPGAELKNKQKKSLKRAHIWKA